MRLSPNIFLLTVCDIEAFFIGYLCHFKTNSCLVDLIDVTLACEDTNSKFVKVVTVADVSDEDRVGNSLLQIWKLRFGQKAQILFRL